MVVVSMYITLMPVIFAGILTMVWCKLPVFQFAAKPMDGGLVFSDGRRLFGENKTWKGLFGYLLWGAVSGILWGIICHNVPFLEQNNFLYTNYPNQFSYNLMIGLAFGAAYALCELPNSFLKRRVGIQPGKPAGNNMSWLFFLLDQTDSLFGCVWILALVYPMSISFYCFFVFLGGITHIVINLCLYKLKLRKNLF